MEALIGRSAFLWRNRNSATSAGDIENNSRSVHGDHGNKHVGMDSGIKKAPNQISTKVG